MKYEKLIEAFTQAEGEGFQVYGRSVIEKGGETFLDDTAMEKIEKVRQRKEKVTI